MTAADRLNEIEARANAATKGPWATYRDGIASPAFVNAPSTAVCEIQSDSFVREPDQGDADGSFIALARTDVPALVAALRAVQEAIDKRGKQLQEALPPSLAALATPSYQFNVRASDVIRAIEEALA